MLQDYQTFFNFNDKKERLTHWDNMRLLKATFMGVLLFITCMGHTKESYVAEDFTLKDVYGKKHHLYSYLTSGKSVILNFSSTWCKPCWNYEQSGVLDRVWRTFGPEGTDDVVIILIEADESTCDDCLFGQENCNDFTYGNWAQKEYPTVSLNRKSLKLNKKYQVDRFPSIIGISAKDYTISSLGQLSFTNWNSWISRQKESFQFSFLNRVEATKNKRKYFSENIFKANSTASSSLSEQDYFEVYPNPCAESLQIFAKPSSLTSLVLFDNKGNKVENIPYSLKPGFNKIDLKGVKSGVYFAKVNSGRHEKIKKIIVIK